MIAEYYKSKGWVVKEGSNVLFSLPIEDVPLEVVLEMTNNEMSVEDFENLQEEEQIEILNEFQTNVFPTEEFGKWLLKLVKERYDKILENIDNIQKGDFQTVSDEISEELGEVFDKMIEKEESFIVCKGFSEIDNIVKRNSKIDYAEPINFVRLIDYIESKFGRKLEGKLVEMFYSYVVNKKNRR